MVHLGPFVCLTELGAKQAELVQKFVPRSRVGVFGANAPNPPDWTLNSCFVAFHTVLVHFRPFGCLAKLEAKHSELVQKFVPQSRVGIFCNERIRCTPFDPKLMFSCVSDHCDAFGIVKLPNGTRGQMFRASAKVRATKSRRRFSQRTHLIHPIGT